MVPRISRRSLFRAAAVSVLSVGLAACAPWGRRNDQPSDEALAAIESLTAALERVPGVERVEARFVTHAMQKHEIFARVDLQADLGEAQLVGFGVSAHAAVLAHQVDPYVTNVVATGTVRESDLHWTITVDSDPDQIPAAVEAVLAEAGRGAHSTRIQSPIDGYGQQVGSGWRELDEAAMLAAMPGGIAQLERRLDADALGGYTWVNVLLLEGHGDLDVPYAHAVGDLQPVFSSSTTTFSAERRRWHVKFDGREADDPELASAVTDFLRTLRVGGGRWDELEFHYPWHVVLAIDGDISVARWLDGNSDRAAAERALAGVLADANA